MASKGSTLGKFDPADHPTNLYDAFTNYVESFIHEYEAITKDPPSEEKDSTKWHELNRRKQFLGKFASRNFQKDFEDCATATERTMLTFLAISQHILEYAKRIDQDRPYKVATSRHLICSCVERGKEEPCRLSQQACSSIIENPERVAGGKCLVSTV